MQAILDHIEVLSSTVSCFWFKPERPLRYTAGQFIEMYLPHNHPDSRGQKHWFTLSSSPTEPLISITTRHIDKKGSTFKQTLLSLKPGDSVSISDPMGDFVLPKDTTIPLVFIAGGIGVTPFRSIVKWLVDTGEKRQLQVLLAARTPGDFVFLDTFKSYGIVPILVSEQTGPDWPGLRGRLSAAVAIDAVGSIAGKRIYISGPEPMVEALNTDMENLGATKDQLVGDFFSGYSGV